MNMQKHNVHMIYDKKYIIVNLGLVGTLNGHRLHLISERDDFHRLDFLFLFINELVSSKAVLLIILQLSPFLSLLHTCFSSVAICMR